MTVNEGAMSLVKVLAVCEGNIAVGFFAGEHDTIGSRCSGANYLHGVS